MIRTLGAKIGLALVLVVLVAVAAVAILANRATADAFARYLGYGQIERAEQALAQLRAYYETSASWDGAESILLERGRGQGRGAAAREASSPSTHYVLADAQGTIAADSSGLLVGQPAPNEGVAWNGDIVVGDSRVGSLLVLAAGSGEDPWGQHERDFMQRVNQAIALGGGVAAILAIGLGIWLSRRLTQPLRELDQAAQRIAGSDLSSRVEIRTEDEIGAVGKAFNRMASALQEEEALRKQLMADVAHDLRTPLTVIQGNVEALQDGVFEPTRDNLGLVLEETVLLSRLIDDLRDLALSEAGRLSLNLEPTHLGELLGASVRGFMAHAAEQNVSLHATIPDTLPAVDMDPQRIQQVMANLLSNALRHTPAGGEIRVEAALVPSHAEQSPGATLPPAEVEVPFLLVSVHDTGEGIPSESLEHIFDRYYRVGGSQAHSSGGTGLGLTIARSLIRAHQGEIAVRSELGVGSTFSFAIPVSAS